MIFVAENTIYSLIAGHFFAMLLYGTESVIAAPLGLFGTLVLLVLTHYNNFLNRKYNHYRH